MIYYLNYMIFYRRSRIRSNFDMVLFDNFEYIEKNVFFKSSLVFELSCPRDEYYNKTDELITHISA